MHASCVALAGRAALIVGRSGSGKSALALQLMALGAELVADDVTELRRLPEALSASAPPALIGLVEARGMGLLAAEHARSALVALVVDLDEAEGRRHPPARTTTIGGVELPLIRKVEGAHFPAAVLQRLKGGRAEHP